MYAADTLLELIQYIVCCKFFSALEFNAFAQCQRNMCIVHKINCRYQTRISKCHCLIILNHKRLIHQSYNCCNIVS